VTGTNELQAGDVFVEVSPGVPDGYRFDVDGNLWTSAGGGVLYFRPNGTPLGKMRLPQMVANLTFGGPKRNQHFTTSSHALCVVYLGVNGAQRP